MTEQLVSCPIALLLKEKSFNIPCYDFYLVSTEKLYEDGETNHNEFPDEASAPRLSLVQKWIREKYEIHVYPIRNPDNTYVCSINGIWLEQENIEDFNFFKDFDTYELALEEGLIYALNLIKNT